MVTVWVFSGVAQVLPYTCSLVSGLELVSLLCCFIKGRIEGTRLKGPVEGPFRSEG